jgi:FMN phosphatase YigB (HAD superfamily)
MKNYKNIIFDLGAVLINWDPNKMIKEQEIDVKFLEIIHSNYWQKLDQNIISKDSVINIFTGKFKKEEIINFFDKVTNFISIIDSGIKILDKIKEKNYKIYILSNFSKDAFEDACKKHDYEKHFLSKADGKIISYQVQAIKPEPDIYQILLNTYNLNPEECLFIDDKEENIIAANNLGIDGIICKDHKYLENKLIKKGILERTI